MQGTSLVQQAEQQWVQMPKKGQRGGEFQTSYLWQLEEQQNEAQGPGKGQERGSQGPLNCRRSRNEAEEAVKTCAAHIGMGGVKIKKEPRQWDKYVYRIS